MDVGQGRGREVGWVGKRLWVSIEVVGRSSGLAEIGEGWRAHVKGQAVASGGFSVCRVQGVCVLDATYMLTAVSALPPGLAEAESLRRAHAVPVAPPLPAVGAVLVLARLAVEAWLADAEPDLVAVSAVAAAVDAAGLVADLARPRGVDFGGGKGPQQGRKDSADQQAEGDAV